MQKTREVTADRSALVAIMSAHVSSFLLGIRNAQERAGHGRIRARNLLLKALPAACRAATKSSFPRDESPQVTIARHELATFVDADLRAASH